MTAMICSLLVPCFNCIFFTLFVGKGNGNENGNVTYAIPQPVGSGGETDATGSDGNREDLADDDPGTRTPGGREEEDVDADEGDQSTSCAGIIGEGGADCTDDELADNHTECTPDEESAAAESLDGPERDGGGADVHEGEDQGDEEGVRNRVQ